MGVQRKRAEVRSLSLSTVSPPPSLPRPHLFGKLCMYVFEVCPFVLEDCGQLVLTIECVSACGGGRGGVCVYFCWRGGRTEGVEGLM